MAVHLSMLTAETINAQAGGAAFATDPTLMLVALCVALIALIVSNTALQRKFNESYEWWYAFIKIVAYSSMFLLSIATTGPVVAVSMISTYVGMELQRLLTFAHRLGIHLDFFNGNRSNKQAQ